MENFGIGLPIATFAPIKECTARSVPSVCQVKVHGNKNKFGAGD